MQLQRMKNLKPKLRPLIKRFGWFAGINTWLLCRDAGCQWTMIEAYAPDTLQSFDDGSTLASGMVKLRCNHCETVRITRIHVVAKDGHTIVTTATGERVNRIDDLPQE
jgi:hypothetical protein